MPVHKIDKHLLRQLCSRPQLSDIDIAARFGVTREAIRYARNRMGITGRGRARLQVVKQRAELLKRKKIFERKPLLRKIEIQARKRGIPFELLLRPPRGHWMRIGNTVCYQIKASARKGSRYPGNSYITLRRPAIREQFDLLIVKPRRGWLVLAPHLLPRSETMFVVGRRKKNPGAVSYRSDWASYYYAGWNWLDTLRVPES